MLDDELRALVSIDPPPGFQARVRAAIATQPAPSRWWQARGLWLMPAAAAAVAGLAIATWLKAPVERPREPQVLQARAMVDAAPLPGRIGHRPPGVTTSKPAASPPAIQFDAAEGRALRALFSSAPAISIVTFVPPENSPIVIPEISIAPLVAADSPQGDRQ
jgi:hypothetical protein